MRPATLAKAALRSAIAAPGVRHALRWFINEPAVPARWRDLAHRKVAKRARFGDASFAYTTPAGTTLRFLHTGTGNYLYWQRTYEPETTTVFCALAARSRVIADIGAADGLYAIFAAAANPAARILAFEPGAAAVHTFERNRALNAPLAERIEIHALALGDRDEEATLYVAGASGGTSSLNPQFRAQHHAQRVRVRHGDGMLAELGVDRVDLVKIDTESTEPAVLRGLARQLERHRPDLIVEVLHGRTEAELDALLRPLGYRYYWMSERGLERHEVLAGDPTYRCPNYLFTVRPPDELAALEV